MKRILIEDKIINILYKYRGILITISITLSAIIIRLAGFNFESYDYKDFIQQWINYLRENGNILGIASVSSNYTVPSLLLYSLISYLPETLTLWAVKILSCIFDFILALFSWKIIFLLTGNIKKSIMVYALILFCPTVFLNSGIWGQAESIFTSFLVISFYLFINNKVRLSLFFYGVALSFKLQAIFIFPFFIFMYLYKKWNLLDVIYTLIGFFCLNAPMWLFRVSFLKWAKVYFGQIGGYSELVLNAPTIYAIVPMSSKIGIILMTLILIGMAFYILDSKKKFSNETALLLVLICSSFIPFILPHMHERYFYIEEIFVIIYVVINSKNWLIALLIIFPSINTYVYYLYEVQYFVSLQILAIIMGTGIIQIWKQLYEKIEV